MSHSPIVITPRKVGSMIEVSFFDGRNTMMTDLMTEGEWKLLKQEMRKAADGPDGEQAVASPLLKAAAALRDYIVSHPCSEFDIPDEIWIPFSESVKNAGAERTPNITGERLGKLLATFGIINTPAIEDPEGYDGWQTMNALHCAARELQEGQTVKPTATPTKPKRVGRIFDKNL